MIVPPYVVRMIQSEANFYKVFPLKSNIAEHNLLKRETDIIFAPAPVSILHLTSILGPGLLSSVSTGTMCTLVQACDLSLYGVLLLVLWL